VFASEQMDEDPGWRDLDAAELVHVDSDLRVTSRRDIADEPAHKLPLHELGVQGAASQHDAPRP
jgi:glutamine amidotransferase